MRELSVYIELNGIQTLVGKIAGESYLDARFRYEQEYLDNKEKEINLKEKIIEELELFKFNNTLINNYCIAK